MFKEFKTESAVFVRTSDDAGDVCYHDTGEIVEFDEAETIPETDRIYWLRDGVELELKARAGEAWRALLPIYLHPDICIRHQAAEARGTKSPSSRATGCLPLMTRTGRRRMSS